VAGAIFACIELWDATFFSAMRTTENPDGFEASSLIAIVVQQIPNMPCMIQGSSSAFKARAWHFNLDEPLLVGRTMIDTNKRNAQLVKTPGITVSSTPSFSAMKTSNSSESGIISQ
jgi:hypothetical protein